jgi:hypothetical protein
MNKTSLIGNALHTPPTLFTLLKNVKKQKLFLQRNIQPQLESVKNTNDGSLDATDFKKITHYYGLSVPAILGEAICVLRGSAMTLKERLALTYHGAVTGLYDDFFDKHDMTDEKVRMFMEQPQALIGESSVEKLFLEFYKKALAHTESPALMINYLRKVYQAQIDSKKQASPGLTNEEILDITLNKGGVSVLFYRSVMSFAFQPGEEEALYKMGGLMQLGNDIFDVYKDSLHKIHTPMTTAQRVNDVRKTFRSVMDDSFNSFYKSNFSPINIKKFLRLISMCLCSRCFVCLDQLESKEASTNGIFSPQLYTRKDLVCDMDTVSNKWKTINYFLKN